jgi:hypothetical protein
MKCGVLKGWCRMSIVKGAVEICASRMLDKFIDKVAVMLAHQDKRRDPR